MTLLNTDAIDKMVESMQAQLERELRGAWRAGYDYVHVYNAIQTASFEKPQELFVTQMYAHPSNDPPTFGHRDRTYLHSYDLRNLSQFRVEQLEATTL